MELSDLTLWQWGGTVAAALLVGLSKAGFGTGAGILAVPLMAAVLGPATMLPVMLLVLITGDVFSLIHYKREHDLRALAMLVPGLVLGVGGGFLALDWFRALPDGELWMKRLIGFLSIAFVGIQCYRTARERRLGAEAAAYRPRVWHGVALGTAAGVTSTLAHAGGPLIALFLLPQRLPKKALVGTMIKYFFIGNLIKLVPYSAQGLMTRQNGLLALVLVPAVVAGTFLGIFLHGKFSDRAFRSTVYVLALLMGLYLLLGSQSNHSDGAPEGPAEPLAAAQALGPFPRGLEASRRSDWRAAEGAFRQAAARPGAGQETARFNLALALYRMDRFDPASELFAGLSDSSGQIAAASASLNAGNCAYRLARWHEAAGWYARAVGACGAALSRESGMAESGRQALREVRERARFNLALARRRTPQATQPGLAAPSGASGSAPDGMSGGPAADGTAGTREPIARLATGHGPGPGEGQRELAAVLAHVTARDTGPVLATRRAPAVMGGKNW